MKLTQFKSRKSQKDFKDIAKSGAKIALTAVATMLLHKLVNQLNHKS